jgi:hypothetical protein
MSDGRNVARTSWIVVSIAALSLAVFAGIASQFNEHDMTACSPYKDRAAEGFGNNVNLSLPGGGTVTIQNFRNGAGGIMLANRPVDPSLPLAELKC